MQDSKQRLIKENNIGVVITRRFGVGFSTWYKDINLATDPRIVQSVLDSDEKHFKEACSLINHGVNIDPNVVHGLEVEWVPIGTIFCIEENDGAETVRFYEQFQYITA